MIVPIFEIDAATDDPTVSAGSGRRCVTRTTRAGVLVGWMSIRDPNVWPRSVSGVIPTIVPSTGE